MPLYLKLITLIILPITLTSCAKAQGALAPTGDKYDGYGAYLPDQNKSSSEGFLPDVEASSLEPIINYVDGLNMALTGDFALIRANATIKYGLALANKGWQRALEEDANLAKGLNVHEGKIMYEAVAKAHNL